MNTIENAIAPMKPKQPEVSQSYYADYGNYGYMPVENEVEEEHTKTR